MYNVGLYEWRQASIHSIPYEHLVTTYIYYQYVGEKAKTLIMY